MKAILGAVSVLLIAVLLVGPADAGRRKQKFKIWLQNNDTYELSQSESYEDEGGAEEFPITEADAADIAQSQYPGARVLMVRLLPSGVYAVTLKEGGKVYRVRVNAKNGAIR